MVFKLFQYVYFYCLVRICMMASSFSIRMMNPIGNLTDFLASDMV